ncbi:NAD(P)-binding protein [Clathrospora elynae]|uniref:NAD(P)-binding protein n=1 Tax=Clathrospora elynae TaxID=706981 RepID=A0A6A5SI29_9PLEO|nr:NAD(P)-binding protein [Clathrospora elynae]
MAEAFTTVPAKSSPARFRYTKANPVKDPTTSFAGKTVLITGPNAGLGYEAATKFAKLGASKLIFGVRSLERGQEAKTKIEQLTKCKRDVIELLQLDMGSYASIEKFAKSASDQFPVIHAAVLNAGVAPPSHKPSKEGWEMSLQVNVISTAYLAILLLPKMRESGKTTGEPTHLEFVSSTGHGDVAIESVRDSKSILKKVNDPANFKFTAQYQITKLLEIWVMEHIAAKTSPKEVIVNSSCPGLCKSSIGRDFGIMLRGLDAVFKGIFAQTAEAGSRILVSATTAGADSHGGFWALDAVTVPGELVKSDEGKALSKQFWGEVLDVLKKQNANVEDILDG